MSERSVPYSRPVGSSAALACAVGILLEMAREAWHFFAGKEVAWGRLQSLAGLGLVGLALYLISALLKRARERAERQLRSRGPAYIGWRLLRRFQWTIFPAPVMLALYTGAAWGQRFDPGAALAWMALGGVIGLICGMVSVVRILIDGEV